MIGILPALLSCVDGDCAFIDGIDENLHEGMLEGIIGQMLPDIDGQLIATVHDTTLMDSLPAESVYTIAIDMDGYKAVRCVTSIERVRKTNSIRRKYLGGSFGGIPYLADMGLRGIAEEMREDLGEKEEDYRKVISSRGPLVPLPPNLQRVRNRPQAYLSLECCFFIRRPGIRHREGDSRDHRGPSVRHG